MAMNSASPRRYPAAKRCPLAPADGESIFFSDDRFGPIGRGSAAGAEFDALLLLALQLLRSVGGRRRRDLDGPDPRAGIPGLPAAVGQAPQRARELQGGTPVQGLRTALPQEERSSADRCAGAAFRRGRAAGRQ